MHDMPWKEITGSKAIVIRGGYRLLQVWKCGLSSPRLRPAVERTGNYERIHAEWFLRALCHPEKQPVQLEDLVLSSATGNSVPACVPNRGGGRAGRRMWSPTDFCQTWQELTGQAASLSAEEPQEADDEITFAEQETDRTCRAGEEGRFVGDARPIRDLGQPTGGFTLAGMPAQRSRNPMVITTVERAAASAELGYPPWELGPCAECGQLMRWYGRDVAMFCDVWRAVLNDW
ncbi:hypothetical protein [Streptomyces celluloflavus]|uniref:hypothetical protein n=1 Tax=Streptomyces celluloflavus TaxID=58344 RepID=UPI0036CEA851